MLVSALEQNVADLRSALPDAQRVDLRAERLNDCNLTISSRTHPLLRLEVIYVQGQGVDAEMQKRFSALDPQKVARLERIHFAVDSELRPWFTDGDRYLHPQNVADEFMEQVALVFEESVRRPIRPLA